MFRFPTSFTSVLTSNALPCLLSAAGLVATAMPAVAQQLGRAWHQQPNRGDQYGPIFDATSQIGLLTTGTFRMAHWSFFLAAETVHQYHDGLPERFMYHWVDPVGDLRMSVVRTQSGSAVPSNLVAVDVDFMGKRILTRRSTAAGADSINYQTLLWASRERETDGDEGGDIRDTWTGAFEIRATGSWNLSPLSIDVTASAEARLRQGSEYFWGSNRNFVGIGATAEMWGGYSPVTMRADVSINRWMGPAGSSELWVDYCKLRRRDRTYTLFQIPVEEHNRSYEFGRAFQQLM